MSRFIGFDAHKSYAYVVELREDRRLDYRVAIPEGLDAFKLRLDKDVQLVLEASTGSFRLADELTPHVGRLVVADPAQTRGAISRPATTDKGAAEALARLLASDFVRPVWVPPQEIRSLRSLVELRVKLAKLRTGSMNRLRALLRQELAGPGRLALTEESVLAHIGQDPALQSYAKGLLRMRDFFAQECLQLDGLLHAWSSQSQDARLLMSIPGVGPLVAACIVAQVGDIKRFDSPGKLCSYAGIVPRVHDSGMTRRSGAITRAGRRSLRWALGIAAMGATRPGRLLAQFKTGLCERRPKGVAMTACARKLLVLAWHVWTSGNPCREEDPQRYARKLGKLDQGGDAKA